jgi:phosphopantothenoylcysteine decarboxylase/phosphopantothenate--cysteine ligase
MKCIVTAGPTYEPLDEVRRLTNFSTGRLGSELADFLAARGHEVTLLIGTQATHRGEQRALHVQRFSTTADLRERLKASAAQSPDAIFHAAAVNDFAFGKVWNRSATGELTEMESGKLSTRSGTLLAELVPTPKIIAELREWHPRARLVGWKYEVDGVRADVIKLGQRQLADCRTDACVVNGRAYGLGFGLVMAGADSAHFRDAQSLYAALEHLLTLRNPAAGSS